MRKDLAGGSGCDGGGASGVKGACLSRDGKWEVHLEVEVHVLCTG